LPFSQEIWHWGPFLFVWSGSLLPILLSAGIFGDDIASGRIGVLIIKPIPIYSLFMYRVIGLLLQCIIHIVVVGSIVFTLHRLTGHGSTHNFMLWMISSILLSATWITLSTTLSVFVKREHNTIIIIVATISIFLLLSSLVNFYPTSVITRCTTAIVKYTLPPIEILFSLCKEHYTANQIVGVVLHLMGLLFLYCVLGIWFLTSREFNLKQD